MSPVETPNSALAFRQWFTMVWYDLELMLAAYKCVPYNTSGSEFLWRYHTLSSEKFTDSLADAVQNETSR